jgi:hypothetical protein
MATQGWRVGTTVTSVRGTTTSRNLTVLPWSLVLQKPSVTQLHKSFPKFYVTRRFITVFTRAHHWPLSARLMQFVPLQPLSLGSILILSSHLCLGVPSGFFWLSHQNTICIPLSLPHACYMPCPSHPWFNPNYIWRRVQVVKFLIVHFSPASYHSIPLRSRCPPQHSAHVP